MTLGERIKTCRQQAGMSQEKVAELLGISRQAVTKWETNKSAPSTDNLFKLAEIFGTTVDFLLPEPKTEEDENKITELVLPVQFSNPRTIITLVVLVAILFFLCWNAGQNVGEDIGKFIYHLTH